MKSLVPQADKTELEGHWVALNCVGLNGTHAFPYPLAGAGHMALPIPRGLENVCMGVMHRYQAGTAIVYHSGSIHFELLLHVLILPASLEQVASSL